MVLAFAVAAQAVDAKKVQSKDKDQPSCCSSKVQTSTEAKGTCPFAKSACCKTPVKQTVLLSPKAAGAL